MQFERTAFTDCVEDIILLYVLLTNATKSHPVRQRISYKLAIITYKTNLTKTPAYLSDIIHEYHYRRKRFALAPLQSGTHCHTTVDLLNFSVLASDF